MLHGSLLLVSSFTVILLVTSNPISNLPGLHSSPSFAQYSGYLQVSETNFLFYWFVESAHDPVNDPLVLWLNGGPGCSSVDGLLNEHGPFKVHQNGSLYNNPYSWNQNASVIYLESPVGVGFSYSTEVNYSSNNEKTTQESYEFLLGFYDEYPQFFYNDLYIAGESYGGIYVPNLAAMIVQNSLENLFNLQGLLIGNGLFSIDAIAGAAPLFFSLLHNAISIGEFMEYEEKCGPLLSFKVSMNSTAEDPCFQRISKLYGSAGLNPRLPNYNIYNVNRDCYNSANDSGFYPCQNGKLVTDYMNRIEVQHSLHVLQSFDKSIEQKPWKICRHAKSISYTKNFTAQHKNIIRPVFRNGIDAKIGIDANSECFETKSVD